MANIKSQKKRIITNEKSRMRNRAVKSELKTATRRMKDAVAAGNGAEAYAAACAACRLMDKAASKGVIHKNQAANRKSGIMALANTVATDADRAAYVKPAKKEQKTGSKKAERKAARLAEMKAASEEKAKRREKQPPLRSARPRKPKRPPRPRLPKAPRKLPPNNDPCAYGTRPAIRPHIKSEGAPEIRGSFALEGCYPERKPRIVPAVILSWRSACIFDDNLKR